MAGEILTKPKKILLNSTTDVSAIPDGTLCRFENYVGIKDGAEIIFPHNNVAVKRPMFHLGWLTNERDVTKLQKISTDRLNPTLVGFEYDNTFADTNGMYGADGVKRICKTYRDSADKGGDVRSFPFIKATAATLAKARAKIPSLKGGLFMVKGYEFNSIYEIKYKLHIYAKGGVVPDGDVKENLASELTMGMRYFDGFYKFVGRKGLWTAALPTIPDGTVFTLNSTGRDCDLNDEHLLMQLDEYLLASIVLGQGIWRFIPQSLNTGAVITAEVNDFKNQILHQGQDLYIVGAEVTLTSVRGDENG